MVFSVHRRTVLLPVQDTQQAATRTGRELRRAQTEGGAAEQRLRDAEQSAAALTHELQAERAQHRQLSEQVTMGVNIGNVEPGRGHFFQRTVCFGFATVKCIFSSDGEIGDEIQG